jgi:hypothetical protein
VVATASTTQTAVSVGWRAPAGGIPPAWFEIDALHNGAQVGRRFCFAPCTSVTLTGLEPGPGWQFRVLSGKDTTADPRPAISALVTVSRGCDSSAVCLDVGAGTDGPALLRAQGFLHGLGNAPVVNPLISDLHPKWWRVQAIGGAASLVAATGYGAATTVVISDAWKQVNVTADGGAKTPWSDWNAYRTFVTAYVKAVEATGLHVEYWDVQNEAGASGYYDAAGLRSATTANLLEQFLVAYQAMEAADPRAQMIGPSLEVFQDRPLVYPGFPLDLTTFLDFCASHGIHLGAVSWHEISDQTLPEDFAASPTTIVDHVNAVRSLLAARPQLGSPAIVVNEYGAEDTHALPGWQAGYIAAFEQADVNEANHTCWPDAPGGATDCFGPALDQLLTPDGAQPLAPYWVDAFYASMTGTRLAVRTSDTGVTAFATRDPSGVVRILLGRHQSCVAAVNQFCTQPPNATPAPEGVTLAVHVPAGESSQVRVTVERIPDAAGAVRPVQVSSSMVTVSGGVGSIQLPAVADGEAYTVVIAPGS